MQVAAVTNAATFWSSRAKQTTWSEWSACTVIADGNTCKLCDMLWTTNKLKMKLNMMRNEPDRKDNTNGTLAMGHNIAQNWTMHSKSGCIDETVWPQSALRFLSSFSL